MSITYTFAWWHVPMVVTVLLLLWAIFWPHRQTYYSKYQPDFSPSQEMLAAILLSMAVWGISGALR